MAACEHDNQYLSDVSYNGFNTPLCATCSEDCLECVERIDGPTCV